jgi:inhibitor of KinA
LASSTLTRHIDPRSAPIAHLSSLISHLPHRITPLGDRGILIQLGERIDETTHRRVRAVSARLASQPVAATIDVVPAYASVAVHYDPALVPNELGGANAPSPYERFAAAIDATLEDLTTETLPEPRVVEIPVSYGGELGPDLTEVARRHDLSEEEVVRLHSGARYLVYMLGFAPGFAYLGGLPEALATPRRPEPRTAVPAGTVGIGGSQTGIYPLVSPGGWQLIGRTSVRLFDPRRDPPALLAVGDIVRFRAVAPNELPPA